METPPAPPPWIRPLERGFIVAALVFSLLGGTLLGAVNIVLGHGAQRAVPFSHAQAHAHAQIFGFLALVLAVFGYHLCPRLIRRPLPWPWLARAGLWAFAVAALAHFAGFPIAHYAPGRALVGLSAVALAAGGAAFLAQVWGVLARVESPHRFEWPVRAGAALLCAASLAAAAMGLRLAFQRTGPFLYPLAEARAVWTLAVHGGEVLFVAGIAARLLPGMLGTRLPRAGLLLAGTALVAGAIPVQAAALAQAGGPLAGTIELWARGASGAGLTLLATSFRLGRWRLPRAAMDRLLPWGLRFAFGALGLAGVLRVATAAAELGGASVDVLVLEAERHLVTVGFLVLLFASVAPKLVPGLTGLELRAPALRWVSTLLLAASVLTRCAEAFGAWWPLKALRVSAASGGLAWVGLLAFTGMMIATLRQRPPPPRAPEPIPDTPRARAALARVLGLAGSKASS